MTTEVYKQWKSQNGESYEVRLLKFVDFVKNNGYVAKFEVDGEYYTGEIWECINTETKTKETCIIRSEYEETGNDVGWAYNKAIDQPIDTWVNPLVDEYEDWLQYCNSRPGRIIPRHFNRELELRKQQDKDKLKKYNLLKKHINKELLPYLKLKIAFITRPNLKIANQWKKVDSKIKKQLVV